MPRIDAIGIVVTSIPEAMEFYGRLGCEFGPVFGDGGHVEAQLGGPQGVRLMFDSAASLEEAGHGGETGPRHGIALAAVCDSAAEVDALYRAFAAEGLGRLEPFDAPWGQRYATIHDPWGTQVDLFAWLPGQEPT